MENSTILKEGLASRVIFFYPGEEGTYITNVDVALYSNGIVHLKNQNEELTTHISNIEIVWNDRMDRHVPKGNVHFIRKPQLHSID